MTQAPAGPGGPPSTSPATGDAQAPGLITGWVRDGESGQPLPYTNVVFHRMTPEGGEVPAGGTMALPPSGKFYGRAQPGTYRVTALYIGYERKAVDNVVVAAGQSSHVELVLQVKPILMDVFAVEAKALRASETAVLARQKQAAFVSDAVTSEQIAKAGDSSAAEALQRVTGLSLVDGKYVYVRGLGERYSSTQVNGSSVGSPEPNKRVVPLDLFPSGVLDNVVVQKSYTPDMEGEFAGGVISINTREFIDKPVLAQSLSYGSGGNARGHSFLTYPGGGLDFLGFDNGTRALPGLVQDLAGWRRIGTASGLTGQQIQDMALSFRQQWTPRQHPTPDNYAYTGVFGNGFRLLGHEASLLTSLSLTNNFSNLEKEDNKYTGSVTQEPEYEYRVRESVATTLAGLTTNFNVKLAEHHRLKANLLYTRSSDDRARSSDGINYANSGWYLRQTSLNYVERGLAAGVLNGVHQLPIARATFDWKVSYSEAVRNEPDRRLSLYEADPASTDTDEDGIPDAPLVYRLSSRLSNPLSRIFGTSNEFDRGVHLDLTVPVSLRGASDSKLKAGAAYRYKNRDSYFRRFSFVCLGRDCGDRTLTPEWILTSDNLRANRYILSEFTLENDDYFANHRIEAGYAMADLRLLDPLRLVVGARFEQSVQQVETKSSVNAAATARVVEVRDDDWLPAAGLTYALTPRMNLRLNYSSTLARPELRELSPFSVYNYETNNTERGNPDLKSARIRNYDVRWELYPGPRDYLAVSWFNKDMDRPLEKSLIGEVTGFSLVPVNGQSGNVHGFEVEVRSSLATAWRFVRHPLGTSASPLPDAAGAPASLLDAFGVTFNWSRVHSAVDIATDHGMTTIALVGQASHATNAGLFFAARRVGASLLYKEFGPRLDSFGQAVIPDVYEHPPRGLDASLQVELGPRVGLRGTVENLLDEATEFQQGSKFKQRYKTGRLYAVSLSYHL